MAAAHPLLDALIPRARQRNAGHLPTLAIAHACDARSLEAARRIEAEGLARPLLVGPPAEVARAADAAGIDLRGFELVAADGGAEASAQQAATLAGQGDAALVMKGALHTDELLRPALRRGSGLRTHARVSHVFVLDPPGYGKLLSLTDCVVHVEPHVPAKRAIIANAVAFLQRSGIAPRPRIAVLAATELPNPDLHANADALALVELARAGEWPGAELEGPFGFDNAWSPEAARIKHIASTMPGDADLMLVPDVTAGNLLYKSFTYVGGAECAGVVLGTRVPVALTSRADSVFARVASVALAVLARE